jgi:class 3 adenylate cyclase
MLILDKMNGISDKLPDYIDILENFPVIGMDDTNLYNHDNIIDEVSFSGDRKHYCVCTIDIMNSTKIVSKLNDSQISKYYSLFLNTMAAIIQEFNGSIIKNVGDCLLYYFKDTSDIANISSFKKNT